MITNEYLDICRAIGQEPAVQRKQWEFAFIYWKLLSSQKLCAGQRGVGFGVGTEPLSAAFAAKGCQILATDAPFEINDQGWALTDQHASSLQALQKPHLISNEELYERCQFKSLDMNNYSEIPAGYDFHWSSCVIEHLGGIKYAIDFLLQSSLRLADGGVAVHTTEFNLSSNQDTVDEVGTCILRKSDLEYLVSRLFDYGLHAEPLILDPGHHPYNYHVDAPPYVGYNHLRLALCGYAATSVGIVIRKS